MARKRRGIPGLSFSWKRALGITAAKQRIARATGIPTTKAGRQQKIGRMLTGCSCLFQHTLFPVARPRLHAFTDYTAALRGVLLGVQLAQQKPPEQVKPLLQAALRGVYVSAGSYDLALHGIDNVEMSTGPLSYLIRKLFPNDLTPV